MERKRVRIYSRRGDLGETSLLFGPRVGKDHRRVELSGTIEEFNACIGMIRAEGVDSETDKILACLQRRLFDVGAEVLTLEPAKFEVRQVVDNDIRVLERTIDEIELKLDATRSFIVPSGSKSITTLHFSRTICRRIERRAVALLRFDPTFSPKVIAWFNRVSDLLFVLTRYESKRQGIAEELVELGTPRDDDLL